MARDIERYLNQVVPDRLETMADRFPAPHRLSRAGVLDRSDQNNHLRNLRNVARRMELEAAEVFAETQAALNRLDAEDRLLTEAKLRLDRQKRLSEALGSEDAETRAMCGVLDDDRFRKIRRDLLMGSDGLHD